MRQELSVDPLECEENGGPAGWSPDARRVDLVSAVKRLKADWLRVLRIALGTLSAAAVFAYVQPDVYTAGASFLPPNGSSNIGALASELSLLSGSSLSFPQKTSGDTDRPLSPDGSLQGP